MLVLLITLVPTIKVNASTYTTKDDIIIDQKYYEYFKANFKENNSYKFFAYDCNYGNYTRTCYYGIDSKNNYIKIDYKSSYGSSYDLQITKGVDDNFILQGTNYIEIVPTYNYLLFVSIIFIFSFYIISKLLNSFDVRGVVYAKNNK